MMVFAVIAKAQVTIGDLKAPEPFSLLELVGSKGLRLPHVDDTQRAVLQAQIEAADLPENGKGLLIHNTSCDCMEYWNGEKWISLCEASTTPEVEIDVPLCNLIRLNGKYYKNAPLGSGHSLVLSLNVVKAGSYNLNAASGNGYYFQKSGVFSETGNVEVTLEGFGVPTEDTGNTFDTLKLTCNGNEFAQACIIKVKVETLTMGYRVDCENINTFGVYQTREYMTEENIVKVPINIFTMGSSSNGETIKIETDVVNGIQFSVVKTVYGTGADTLVLKASGTPQKAGTYRFTFTTTGSLKTTCSFAIDCISTLGEFEDPACRCLDIYNENPTADNGEYWLMDCETAAGGEAIKTYCDIKNGGWTLLWSYSEKTARNIYLPTGSMEVNGAYYSVFKADNSSQQLINILANRVTTKNGVINYNNYRLNYNEWNHFPHSISRPQIKVRITENPTDMYDEWALNNYAIISPQNESQNPIKTAFPGGLCYRDYIPTEGKVFGQKWAVKTNGPNYGTWTELYGTQHVADITLYNCDNYCTHWNFNNVNTNNSNALFQVIPNRNNNNAKNRTHFYSMNNMFGWFGQNYEANHHFGKCVPNNYFNNPASINDFDFGNTLNTNNTTVGRNCNCINLYPHTTINGGEGRIIQWFVR